MNHYDLPPSEKLLSTATLLRAGVAAVGVIGATAEDGGCATCYLQLTGGEVLQLYPTECSLERRFEVFPVDSDLVSFPNGVRWRNVDLRGPLQVYLLQTAEWLDATAPCNGALGEGPMLQCQGLPDNVPMNAKAAVSYFGGVELIATNGETLTVSSLAVPYVMHISGHASSEQFDSANYARLSPDSLASSSNADAKKRVE